MRLRPIVIASALVIVAAAALPQLTRRRSVSPVAAPVSNGLQWPNSVAITTDAVYRYVRGNGIPDHPTGAFPNAHNPNTITPQNYSFRLPLNPQMNPAKSDLAGALAAVAINGVPFDPGTAEYWHNDRNSGWHYEALTGGIDLGVDANNAHVQPTGAYHYHATPTALAQRLGGDMPHIGWMADGFPLYATKNLKPSWRVKSGTRSGGPGGAYDGTFEQDWEYLAGLGDLDACNGRIGQNRDGTTTYQYFVTTSYPYVPRCVAGTIDASFMRRLP
jgi:hypothetical protein